MTAVGDFEGPHEFAGEDSPVDVTVVVVTYNSMNDIEIGRAHV